MTHPDPHSRSRYSHHYRSSRHQGVSTHYQQGASASPSVQQRSSRDAHYRRPAAPTQQVVEPPQNLFAAPPQPSRPRYARSRHPRVGRSRGNMLLASAGGGMIALAALAVVPKSQPQPTGAVSDVCQQKVEPQSVLSRAELSQLLSVPERSSKEAVQQVIEIPYCTLEPVSLREGAIAQREAYPLEFDPQTWLVVLYEEGEYAGYDFSFKRE